MNILKLIATHFIKEFIDLNSNRKINRIIPKNDDIIMIKGDDRIYEMSKSK